MYHFTKCDVCPCKFRAKKVCKPFVGYFKRKVVFHWFVPCPSCGYKHFIRFYNEHVNVYYDKMMHLNFQLWLYRKDEDKCDQLLKEYEIAKEQLEIVNNELREAIGV